MSRKYQILGTRSEDYHPDDLTLSRWWQSCWWLQVYDDLWVLVTEKIGMTKKAKTSPKSKSCHQHISSPTSVTNIDVIYFVPNIEIAVRDFSYWSNFSWLVCFYRVIKMIFRILTVRLWVSFTIIFPQIWKFSVKEIKN